MDSCFQQYGDESTADVKLHIILSDGKDYEGNPVYCHSQILKKSEFFEALISERWSSNMKSPSDMVKVNVSSTDAANYIQCLHFMYSSSTGEGMLFADVDEALTIISVASEWLFYDGIQACMKYMESVPWKRGQQSKIAGLLSSINVNVLPDLAARLTVPDLEGVKKVLQKMLCQILRPDEELGKQYPPTSSFSDKIKEYIISNFETNASSDLKDLCSDILLEEYMLHIEDMKGFLEEDYYKTVEARLYGLLWLVDLIKLCDRGTFLNILTRFCEDERLAILLRRFEIYCVENAKKFCVVLLDIINDKFMKAIATGEIVTPKSIRLSFLRNWVPEIAILVHTKNKIEKKNADSTIDFERRRNLEPKYSCIQRMKNLEDRINRDQTMTGNLHPTANPPVELIWPWNYSQVTQAVKTLARSDQKLIFNVWRDAAQNLDMEDDSSDSASEFLYDQSEAEQLFECWIDIISVEAATN